jgi:two-component system LytT family response regulator
MKNPVPCIIVDDETGPIRTISDYIAQMPRLDLIKAYTEPLEALAEMSVTNIPHLIYCDIDMPAFSGINLAEALRDSPPPHHFHYFISRLCA